MTNTSLPGPVPDIHVFEANSLKGQSSICLTDFDPKQILGINSTVFASCPKAAVMTGELHGSAGSTRKQVTLYDCTGSRNTYSAAIFPSRTMTTSKPV